MNIYECPICNVCFHRKAHLEQHLNKKKSCKNKKNSFQKSNQEMSPHNSAQFTHNSTQFTQNTILQSSKNYLVFGEQSNNESINTNESYEQDEHNEQDEAILECKYCLKTFSRKDTLKRHLVGYCRVKKKCEDEKEDIFKKLLEREQMLRVKEEQIESLMEQNKIFVSELNVLKKKINKLSKYDKNIKYNKYEQNSNCKLIDSSISNTGICSNNSNIMIDNKIICADNINVDISNSNNVITNSNNIISNTNNVVFQLVNYGKEDLNLIDTKEFINSIVKNNRLCGVKIPEEILKLIHFNPNYPELNNIYISDINREKCMIYDDGMWKLSPDDKIPEVIDKVVKFSYDKQDVLREKFANNKPVIDRLNIIDKYTKFNDIEYLEELKIAKEEECANNDEEIKRCEEFQKKTYNTFKTTMYNEGLKIKKKTNQKSKLKIEQK